MVMSCFTQCTAMLSLDTLVNPYGLLVLKIGKGVMSSGSESAEVLFFHEGELRKLMMF